jgi:hypothetical protein
LKVFIYLLPTLYQTIYKKFIFKITAIH